jgi:hypothetical protein
MRRLQDSSGLRRSQNSPDMKSHDSPDMRRPQNSPDIKKSVINRHKDVTGFFRYEEVTGFY